MAGGAMARHSFADELVDELVPEGIDWRHLVRSYPLPVLAVTAVGGFLLGRSRGAAIVAALSAFAARQFEKSVNEVLGEEVL